MSTLKILDIVGENAITQADGEAVYQRILAALQQAQPLTIDFSGVKIIASPFLNVAIGQLLKDRDETGLKQAVKFSGLSEAHQDTLDRVIKNSRRFYSDPDYRRAQIEALRRLTKQG